MSQYLQICLISSSSSIHRTHTHTHKKDFKCKILINYKGVSYDKDPRIEIMLRYY